MVRRWEKEGRRRRWGELETDLARGRAGRARRDRVRRGVEAREAALKMERENMIEKGRR